MKFQELQRMRMLWLRLLLGGIFVFLLGMAVYYLAVVEGDEKTEESGIVLAVVSSLIGGLWLMLERSKMETEIDDESVRVKFTPFVNKFKVYEWKDIDQAYVRDYEPIREFGGWGVRVSRRGSGRAFNTKGKVGLQIVLKDGEKVLIGTQKRDELNQAIESR